MTIEELVAKKNAVSTAKNESKTEITKLIDMTTRMIENLDKDGYHIQAQQLTDFRAVLVDLLKITHV